MNTGTQGIAEEIQKSLDAATPGPWSKIDGRIYGASTTAIDPLIHEFNEESERENKNANLIANSPTWLRSLLEVADGWKESYAAAQRKVQHLNAENERITKERDYARLKAEEAWKELDGAETANESLTSQLAAKDKVLEPIREFVKSVIRVAFDGGSLDGGDIQDMGVKHGLLNETAYDPAKHGESDYADPGDPWFVFSDILNATINESNTGGREDEDKHKAF